MNDRTHDLLLRNIREVFSEGNATRRRAAVEELYTEDCVLYVPQGMFVGHDALDMHARMAWGSGPPGEPPAQTGWDVIIVRDEKIAALYVFLDAMPS